MSVEPRPQIASYATADAALSIRAPCTYDTRRMRTRGRACSDDGWTSIGAAHTRATRHRMQHVRVAAWLRRSALPDRVHVCDVSRIRPLVSDDGRVCDTPYSGAEAAVARCYRATLPRGAGRHSRRRLPRAQSHA